MYIAVKTWYENVPNPYYRHDYRRLEPEFVNKQVKDYRILHDKTDTIASLVASGYTVYKISAEVTAKVTTNIQYLEEQV